MTATLPPRLHELYGEEQTPAPTTHHRLRAWVEEVARLTAPADVHWCDGSEADRQRLIATLLASGTLTALNPRLRPDSYCARTDPDDVARVEDRTFICSRRAADAGPTNHWADPTQMITTMTALYRGSMRGRTMYVVPFCMGRVDAEQPMFGVELTDSPYVALSMMIMTRVGHGVLAAMTAGVDAEFVRCLHSVGAPLRPDAVDVPWPCNPTKYISHFPEERMIWSYGSGYGGNSLLGKKCYALRIASAIGRDEGWLAEHMLILKITGPSGRSHHLAAAFPSACGKTNLAMIEPTLPGWRVETLGDDIAWLRVGADGRLWATNPEYGFFGVAPGTGWATNPNAMRTLAAGHTIFTNVALTDDGDVWWEGLTPEPPAHLTDWRGESWTLSDGRPAAHPNSRFCTPISQCPVLAPSFDDPDGVPLDAIVFGGRRPSTVPLVAQAHDWPHGVFLGATLSSETTAAAAGRVGVVRRDPMAMLPFLGYHVADYFAHWLGLGRHHDAARLPQIFHVNWFRRTPDGGYAWPGYGENSRVLKWIVERLEGEVDAVDTPLGLIPRPGGVDVTGLTQPYDLDAALAVRREELQAEVPLIDDWFATVGPTLPRGLRDELDLLKIRLLS